MLIIKTSCAETYYVIKHFHMKSGIYVDPRVDVMTLFNISLTIKFLLLHKIPAVCDISMENATSSVIVMLVKIVRL